MFVKWGEYWDSTNNARVLFSQTFTLGANEYDVTVRTGLSPFFWSIVTREGGEDQVLVGGSTVLEDAMKAAEHYIHNVLIKSGMTWTAGD